MKSILLEADFAGIFVVILLYTGACAFVGFLGKDRNIGFWGAFILSLFTSPILGFIITLLSSYSKTPVKPIIYTCIHCQLQSGTPFYYCIRCLKDKDGYTAEQNKKRFNEPPVS